MEKLLCIKKDNDILLYKTTYNIDDMKNFIDELQKKYNYKKTDVIETEICQGILLSTGKYNGFDFCHIDEKNYEVVETIEEKENEKKCKVKISIKVDSLIGNTLEEIFVKDKDILLNMTKFYKAVNHILDIKNNFKFAEIIDLRNRKKKWNDPGRFITNEEDQQKSIDFLKENINSDNVVLNEKEEKNKNEIYEEVIQKLNSIITFEQVGLFPIDKENDELYKIFEVFGERNKSFEFYFGTLERENVRKNMNGGIFINNISDEVLRTYNDFASKITNNLSFQELIKSKFLF